MRPRELMVEGFGPYKSRQTLNFQDLDLFAISGPTGAGKSSLVDAITYALYGRIYRLGTEVKDFISQDQGTERPRMMVSLEFEVDGRTYRIVRTTGESTPAQVQLEELRGSEWRALEGRARQANQYIERLIGLDFDAFTKSVVLPQNEFHRFLSGRPEERRAILDQLLSLGLFETLRQRASQEGRNCQADAARIAQELSTTYAEATPDRARALRQELKTARQHLAKQQTRVEVLKEGHGLAAALRDAAKAQTAAQTRRDDAAGRVARAEADLASGSDAIEPLRRQAAELRQRVEAMPYDAGEHQKLIRAEAGAAALAQARKDVQTWEEQVEKGKARLTQDLAAEQAARAALEDAEAAVEAARTALEEARRHNLAAALRSGLKPGDACPVCGQPIGELPRIDATDVRAAEDALDRAEAAVRTRRAGVDEAARRTAETAAKLGTSRERLQEAIQRVEGGRKALVELLGPGEAEGAQVDGLRARLGELERLRKEREDLNRQRDEAERKLHEHEQRLAGARGQLDAAREELARVEEEARDLAAAFDAARTPLAAWIDRAGRTDLKKAFDRGADLAQTLEQELETAREAASDARERVALLESQAGALDERIQRAKELRHEHRRLTERGRLAEELARLLRADRLPAFIRTEALRALAAAGSERLAFLSGDRYGLEVEGQEFLVVDRWNAGETRSVRTLSGGETFLASLALALALAERLPELAATGRDTRLESLFLDEGFGALDAETLEVAGQALDRLRSEERLVGVITHVEELAERLPARVRVVKDINGSRLEID